MLLVARSSPGPAFFLTSFCSTSLASHPVYPIKHVSAAPVAQLVTELTHLTAIQSVSTILCRIREFNRRVYSCRQTRRAATCVRSTSGIQCPFPVDTYSAPSASRPTGTMLTTQDPTTAPSAGSPTTRGPPRDGSGDPDAPAQPGPRSPSLPLLHPRTTSLQDPRTWAVIFVLARSTRPSSPV